MPTARRRMGQLAQALQLGQLLQLGQVFQTL
jgi:hypothetical protein